tara:strand:+ start:981 stop:1163 length:183 start_codon:yes stop_codon:yes gene_type:complete
VSCYKITYTRLDMPGECGAIKHAHTKEEALKHLVTGNSKKGYKLKRSGVAIKLINIEEIK